jgi:hypothetical protein
MAEQMEAKNQQIVQLKRELMLACSAAEQKMQKARLAYLLH